jgi:hypothetical protein
MFTHTGDYEYEKKFRFMVAVLDFCPDGEQHAVRRYQFCDSAGHGSSIMTLAENELCDVRSVSGNIPGAKRRGILRVSTTAAWTMPSLLIRGVIIKFREVRYE